MFTTRCFIHKNTTELREKIEDLGYTLFFGTLKSKDSDILSCQNDICFVVPFVDANEKGIDCGENEELFLALAALQDTADDSNQWFVMDVEVYVNLPLGTWFKATKIGGGKHVGTNIEPSYCHKATKSEIIEHFKRQRK
jgi:hypothetical protein